MSVTNSWHICPQLNGLGHVRGHHEGEDETKCCYCGADLGPLVRDIDGIIARYPPPAKVVAVTPATDLQARVLLHEALLLAMHGERPPGAPSDPDAETWADWFARVEAFLRAPA